MMEPTPDPLVKRYQANFVEYQSELKLSTRYIYGKTAYVLVDSDGDDYILVFAYDIGSTPGAILPRTVARVSCTDANSFGRQCRALIMEFVMDFRFMPVVKLWSPAHPRVDGEPRDKRITLLDAAVEEMKYLTFRPFKKNHGHVHEFEVYRDVPRETGLNALEESSAWRALVRMAYPRFDEYDPAVRAAVGKLYLIGNAKMERVDYFGNELVAL